jgi:hypothetical protein
MDRILKNTGATLQLLNYDSNGALANGAVGAMTATVTDSGGVAIAGSPFTITNPPASGGTYLLALPAAGISQLDRYTVTWNFADGSKRYTYFEVVGGFLFSVAELRSTYPELAANPPYTTALITAVREAVEERFEEVSGSFVRRGRRVTLSGNGLSSILLDMDIRSVVSASVNSVALTSGELADVVVFPSGEIYRRTGSWASGVANISLLYEYGSDEPPEPIRRAAMMFARDLLVKTATDSEARAVVGFSDTIGPFRLGTPGAGRATGIPEVDAVLVQFSKMLPVM